MFEKALDRVAGFLLVAGCLLTFLMMVHVTLDVVGKYVLGLPIMGTLEVVTYVYMVGCIFLPLAQVQRHRGQVMVEVFTHSLSPRSLAFLDAIVALVCALFVALLAWQCARYAWLQTTLLETTKVSDSDMQMWFARWFSVAGFGCCAMYQFLQAAQEFRSGLSGKARHASSHISEGEAL